MRYDEQKAAQEAHLRDSGPKSPRATCKQGGEKREEKAVRRTAVKGGSISYHDEADKDVYVW
jgi:hypothetical protein